MTHEIISCIISTQYLQRLTFVEALLSLLFALQALSTATGASRKIADQHLESLKTPNLYRNGLLPHQNDQRRRHGSDCNRRWFLGDDACHVVSLRNIGQVCPQLLKSSRGLFVGCSSPSFDHIIALQLSETTIITSQAKHHEFEMRGGSSTSASYPAFFWSTGALQSN